MSSLQSTASPPSPTVTKTVRVQPVRNLYDATGSSGAAFFTPDGNIVCLMGAPDVETGAKVAYVRCDISQASYQMPTRPKNCHGNYGLDFGLVKKATLGCITDTIASDALLKKVPLGFPQYTAWFDRKHNPRVKLTGQSADGAGLGYGNEIKVGNLTCLSKKSGVTCTNTLTGKGFTISSTAYQLF